LRAGEAIWRRERDPARIPRLYRPRHALSPRALARSAALSAPGDHRPRMEWV